jgi:predicted transcriptional regulator
VRDVYETLREQRQIAYTTVMTVMNNLVKKGLLSQDRSAIAYVYKPAIPGDEVADAILDLDSAQEEELRRYAEEHFAA